MGKKSNAKAKQKKLKHKQELSELTSKFSNIASANSLEDPLAMLEPFRKFERNSLDVSITCQKVMNLDEGLHEWAFNLTKANMEELYECCGWGWNDRLKKEEMENEKAWYLIAKEVKSGEPVAMVHFRFDIDNGEEVIYCYEIQLIQKVRKMGLGKFLMQILELLANKTFMKKVVLTVFKQNLPAQHFFKEKMKYQVDESSIVDAVYDILSKKVHQKTQIISDSCCSCCTHH